MPTIFQYDGHLFFFYSYEGDPREPMHVHMMKAGCEAKFWLRPEVALARGRGFDGRTLARLERVVAARRDMIERARHGHFG